jgi:carboxyl-terminal processing protease
MYGAGKFYKIKRMSSPIAVLIDSLTASSGEMTAISFIGLRNVRTFGQPSAGYTSANGTYRLSNGAILQLANAYAADRKKNTYKERIYPNVHIGENTKTADDTLEAAMEWVMKEGS